MARISASSENSAAFDKKDHLYIWGDTTWGKMGVVDIN
jgi:hypothetical protein